VEVSDRNLNRTHLGVGKHGEIPLFYGALFQNNVGHTPNELKYIVSILNLYNAKYILNEKKLKMTFYF